MSKLIGFLTRRRCFVRREEAAPARTLTHLLMDGQYGGKLRVPDELMPEFYAAYGEDVEAGLYPCVVELRSPVFKLHYDVDIKRDLSDEELRAIARVVYDASCLYFAADPPPCVVCSSVRDGRRAGSSLHLVFPHGAAVDEARALAIRAGVLSRCGELLGHLGLDFNQVIDPCVFGHSGFRMVYSDKCRSCEQCRGRKDAAPFCPDCHRQGKIMERRVYTPWLVLPEDGHDELRWGILSNKSCAVKRCAIRMPLGATVSASYGAPAAAPEPCYRRSSGIHEPGPAEPPGARLLAPVSLDASARRLLEDEVRRFHPMYSGVDVREVRANARRRSYVVKICGPGSRYCSNKRGEHASNSAYFVATRDGLSQRCYSRKPEERGEGLCAHYSSSLRPLSDELRAALFALDEGSASSAASLGGDLLLEPEFPAKRPRA